jgi:PAS domain S-box-containing protein
MGFQTVEQYEALIDHSTDIIAQFDEAGTIQFVSPAVEQVLGYTPDELVGRPAFDLLHPEDRVSAMEAFDRIVDAPGESTERQEHRFQHAGGSWVWAESVTTNRTESALEGYVINSRAITERKQYEQRLEETTKKLEVLNRTMRHDIRNDMSIILGWGEVLEDHVDEAGREYLEKVLATGDHILELTESAGDYAESLTDEAAVERKPTSLRSVLTNELSLRRESFPETEFAVAGEIPDVAVVANEMLGSVFRNLLNNAVHHNDAEEPLVEIRCEVGDEMATVRVADNGPGIPDDRKQSIFSKGENDPASQGRGIGLYLVETLTNQYGGTVRVENNDPTGTVFIIRLPIAE